MKNSKNTIWILTFVLIIIEQGIKIIINNSYLNTTFPILEPYIYFNPMFNRDYSWFNSMLQLGISKWLHIILVSVILILIFLFYKFLNKFNHLTPLINTTFLFIFSGAACSLIDKVFWNGSLDYILVKGFFTFDLKDVYVSVFTGLIIIMLIFNYKGLRTVNEKDFIKKFFRFILNR